MTWTNRLEIIENWGWRDNWSAEAERLCPPPREPARVIGQDRDLWSLQTTMGPRTGRLISFAGEGELPVVGDWVVSEPGPTASDPWSIHSLFTRRTRISRGMAGTGMAEQVLAANIDSIWIVHGLDMPVNQRRLERYLAVAWESGALPEIILTKADMTDDADAVSANLMGVAAGVDVHTISALDSTGIEHLRERLAPGVTICLLGPSGVGKSTLVNALAGTELAKTAVVREGDRKGRHTTTRRELFRIPGGACLLDTPGIRELRIWLVDKGLNQAFPDIEELAADCRFRDCRHENEPGCAVLGAVAAGSLSEERLMSFRKLQAEAAYEQRKSDPRARAAAVSEYKSTMKSMKHHPKYRDRR